jgi:hypothetical protein
MSHRPLLHKGALTLLTGPQVVAQLAPCIGPVRSVLLREARSRLARVSQATAGSVAPSLTG